MQKAAQGPPALNPQQVLNRADGAIFSSQMQNHLQRAVPWVGGGMALGSLLGGLKILGQTAAPNLKKKKEEEEGKPLQFSVPSQILNKRASDLNNIIGPTAAVAGIGGGGILGYKLVQALVNANKKSQRKYMENQAIGDLNSAIKEQYMQARPKDMLSPKAAAALDELAENVIEKKAETEWPVLSKLVGYGLGAASVPFLIGAYNEYHKQKELAKKIPQKAKMLKSIADAQRGPAPLQLTAVPQQ